METPTTRSAATAFMGMGMALVAYTYAGYPLLMGAVARRRATRGTAGKGLPAVTVVIPAHDEEDVIATKVADTFNLDYPSDRLEVLVVADGSTDATADKASAAGARALHDPVRAGKSAAVNRGVAAAGSDIVVLTDANCSLAGGALRAIVAPFGDERVGVVSGAKRVVGDGIHGRGEGLYWRYEARLKHCESAVGATMGAPGELLAVRRAAFRPLERGVINDDYHLVCKALRDGWEVRFAPDAVAYEAVSPDPADEWERRTRIAAGTWQTTVAHLTLAHPRRGWTAVAFVSHRILRTVIVPLLLPLIWAASLVGARRSRLARFLVAAQTGFYGVSLAGATKKHRALAAPFQFVLTNAATLRGGWRWATRRQPVAWTRVSRAEWYKPGHSG